MKQLMFISKIITQYFSIWVILISIIAYFYPSYFILLKPYIAYLLGTIMFAMGISLNVNQFKKAFSNPIPILLGCALQFGVMPALGYWLAIFLELPTELAVGVILVGCCPGGTASNVIVFLSKGNVALSVAMTSVSTLFAPLLTPYLLLFYAEKWMAIDASGLLVTTLKIVLVPIILGLAIKKLFPLLANNGAKFAPSFSVLGIVAIIGFVVAINNKTILSTGAVILVAVILHNLIGLLIAYWIAYFTGQNNENCRTIAIEVGMQNSGLGVVLANAHFSPLTAIPSAIFSLWHNISGSLIATYFARKPSLKNQ